MSALLVPDDATYPRLMTGPHPRAVGTYGPEAAQWALDNPGMHLRPLRALRWWQRLALDRALEHDADGRLVWQTVVISGPRQCGKSYLERIVLAWRLHLAEWFGGPQDLLHLAHKLQAAQEVWRPAARWAAGAYGKGAVRWTNGEQAIELDDGSRWLIQAANDGAGVSFSLSMVLVDEAWRVHRHIVDAALVPTMAEAEQPQLWLVSTAGTSQSDLMHSYRALGLALAEPRADDSLLLIEWSAPPDPDLDIDDPATWRNASPHWDARRESRIAKARGETGELVFRQQWLNQWVPAVTAPVFDPLDWDELRWPLPLPEGSLALGVDVAADRSHACIVGYAAGVAEVIEHRDGASWVAGRVAELVSGWEPSAVGLDSSGPAASIADQLGGTEAGELLVPMTGKDLSVASAHVFDLVSDGSLRAVPSAELDASVIGARKRSYGQSWAFARQTGDISGVPLLALVAAVWASDHAAARVERSRIW